MRELYLIATYICKGPCPVGHSVRSRLTRGGSYTLRLSQQLSEDGGNHGNIVTHLMVTRELVQVHTKDLAYPTGNKNI